MFIRMCILLFSCVSLSAYELSILAMFRDESNYLKEWVDYHRLVGVQHFWLYNDHSTDNWESVLQPYIDEGVVNVITWTGEGGFKEQLTIYKEGIVNARGKTKWLAIIDIDEFILPMHPKEQTVLESLDKHYQNASAVFLNWRNFGTGKITLREGESLLQRLTACSLPEHPNNNVGKSIIRPECMNLEAPWSPHHVSLNPGLSYYNGSGRPFDEKIFSIFIPNTHRYLRINHYVLRDEYFFQNYRYPRKIKMGEPPHLLMEHYQSFSRTKDFAIQRFVEKLHP